MKLSNFLRLCASFGAFNLATHAAAQEYPVHPIRLIVPAVPGGSWDSGARATAQKLTEVLGQPVVVDNKSGAGGRIGAAEAARATPDGYTLLYGSSISQALYPAVSKSMTYDNLNDFIPLGQTFWYSTVLVCNPSMPFSDFAGFVDYAKKNPGKLTAANAGIGSGNHFSNELLARMAGVDIYHVPFRGNAPGLQAVLANIASCTSITEAKAFVDAGKLKALATTGKLRDPRFPNLPTVDEAGLKGYETTWWHAVYAPKGTPSAIVQKLERAVRQVTTDPKVKAATIDVGLVQQYLTPMEVTQRTLADMAKFQKIAAENKIELD